jgi:isopenicillin N synthase-like dioxygenase
MYHLVTAEIQDGELVFASDADFDEVLKVGFFRIKTPPHIDLSPTRLFAKQFFSAGLHADYKPLGLTDGYFESDKNQSVHLALERDNWHLAYKPEVQLVGQQLADVGTTILRTILKKCGLPPALWFQATSGASENEGSYFLVVHNYDPRRAGDKPFGLREHRDWGYVTVLDTVDPGLEAEIRGRWEPITAEEGYLIINFGEPLHKLLPQVNSSKHRVTVQTQKCRTSTVVFIDPRVGPYRAQSPKRDVGMVWDFDPQSQQLINGQTTLAYFEVVSDQLYGER